MKVKNRMKSAVPVDIKEFGAAISAAKKLKVKDVVLVSNKSGLLFAAFTQASVYIKRISDEKMIEQSCQVELERLVSATNRAKELALELSRGNITVILKGNNSKINLAAETADTTDIEAVWESRGEGKPAPMLANLLVRNAHIMTIKDNVADKPVPVHIRWNKLGVTAGMSDQYHGVAIKTDNAPKEGDKSQELFIYSEWLPLLIEYLNEKAKLSLSERSVVVSADNYLLSLQAVIPGEDTVTLTEIETITAQATGDKIKMSMESLNQTVTRSLAVLSKEDNLTMITSFKKPGILLVKGSSPSGSTITESISFTSRKAAKLAFNGPVYNLKDVTAACVPEMNVRMAGRAVLFDFAQGSADGKGEVYNVLMFMAVSS
jgi:hypothetical protein